MNPDVEALVAIERQLAEDWCRSLTARNFEWLSRRWCISDRDPTRFAQMSAIVDWYWRMDWPRCFCAAARRVYDGAHFRHRASLVRARRVVMGLR